MADKTISINKRDEFAVKCRHQNKFRLNFFKYDKEVDLLKDTENITPENIMPQNARLQCNDDEQLKIVSGMVKERISSIRAKRKVSPQLKFIIYQTLVAELRNNLLVIIIHQKL